MSPMTVCLSLLCLALGSHAQQVPDMRPLHASPCPAVYSYGWEGGWFGVITILPPARFSEVQLVLRMTVPYYRPEAGVGRLEVKGGTPEVQDISRSAHRGERRPYHYKVIFPPTNNLYDVPRVQLITINGKIFCEDSQVYADTRSTIELQFTLRTGLNVPFANGNDFSVVSTAPSKPGSWGNPTSAWQEPSSQETANMRPQPRPATTTTPVDTPSEGSDEFQGSWGNPTSAWQEPSSQETGNMRPWPRPATTTTPAYTPSEGSDEFQVDGLNCGVPQVKHNYLVVGGTTAESGRWPWQAAIFKNSNTGLDFHCGGTLVSKRHVITSAHCVHARATKKTVSTDSITIYLGRQSLRSWTEDGLQAKDVDKIIVHPNYAKKKQDYDVSVLTLSTSVEFSMFVVPVCLWDKSPSLGPLVNVPGTVVGWGRDDEGQVAKELQVATMLVVSQETCLRSGEFYTSFTSNATFCAGYRNGTSVCNGDSGGGMFFYLDNHKQHVKTWYTRGVVSISQQKIPELICDDKNYVVFTDLAKMLPWLQRQLVPPVS